MFLPCGAERGWLAPPQASRAVWHGTLVLCMISMLRTSAVRVHLCVAFLLKQCLLPTNAICRIFWCSWRRMLFFFFSSALAMIKVCFSDSKGKYCFLECLLSAKLTDAWFKTRIKLHWLVSFFDLLLTELTNVQNTAVCQEKCVFWN